MNRLDALLERLQTTSDASERNALAIEAAETGAPEVQRVLIELIGRPALMNNRGTLVNCLARFDCSGQFLWLVELVCHGNWEVSHEAMGILENTVRPEAAQIKPGYEYLLKARAAGVGDAWRAGLIADLLSMFD